jgi:hypothetical protein
MTRDTVEIHNPTYAKRSVGDSVAHVPLPRPQPGDSLRISYIDNEKPNTTRLLELVTADLARDYKVETRRFTKGGAGLPAPVEVIHDAARYADLAILATCD